MAIKIQDYLEQKKIEGKRRGDEFICNCPFCDDHEKKFQMNLITGTFICNHANKCGVKGNFFEFQKKMGDKPEKLNEKPFKNKEKKTYNLPTEDVPKMENKQIPVYKWLKARGFNDETIQHFHIGAKENTVILPFYRNGQLINIKYRDILDKKAMRMTKDGEHILFNRDNVTSDTLIITEGEFDAMALHQYGIEAVSVPNGASGMAWIEREWDFLETFDKILICFDQDDAGKEGASKVAVKLGLWNCSLVELPMKDANECLLKGVSKEIVEHCFDDTIELVPATLVSPTDFNDKIQTLFAMGTRLFGDSTPWSELDSVLKGWRGSETTIWTGRNGAGKSTVLNQIVLDAAGKGKRCCIYSGEMAPERYLRWAVIQYTNNNNPSPMAIEKALQWMDDKLYILNISAGIDPNKLLSDFEYAARRYDVKHFIVDSLMKVKLNDSDEYNEQKKFVSQLSDFSKKFNVHAHLVAHPRKTATDNDEPGKVDVKGSSHITDLADNVIVLYRPSEEQKEKAKKKNKKCSDLLMCIKKNREFGYEGNVLMWYNDGNKKFSTKEIE